MLVATRPARPTRDLDEVTEPLWVEPDRATGLDARPPTGHLPGLDGLRAVAVLAVIAFHLRELPGGFLGVDVFFVVSGFLITRLLLAEHERTGRVALGAFWGRRFRRLVPALLVVLVAVAVASRLWLPAWRLPDGRDDAFGALAYVANWRFLASGQGYFQAGTVSPLRHTWSLAIEEQFYVVWPLLILAATWVGRRRARRSVAVMAGAVALASAAWMAVAASHGNLTDVYYRTDTRLFALAAGAWLATWWDPLVHRVPDRRLHRVRNRRLARTALACLVPLAVLMVLGHDDVRSFYRYGFQLTAVLSVVIVAGVATGTGSVIRVFEYRVLGWIGRRSYGLYLWSWPVQVFAEEHFRLERPRLDAVVMAATFALATVSYWLVEQPVRLRRAPTGFSRRGSLVAPHGSRQPRVALGAMSVVAVVALVVVSAVGAPPAPSYARTSDAEAVAAALAPGHPSGVAATQRAALRRIAAHSASTPTAEGLPSDGPLGPFDVHSPALVDPRASIDPLFVRGRPLRIMIAGDSVGWSLGYQLPPGLTRAIQLSDRALIGCGVMPADSSFLVRGVARPPYGEPCAQATQAEAIGLQDAPDVVLLSTGAWEVFDHVYRGHRYVVGTPDAASFLEQRLQGRIDRFRSAGAATVIPLVPCFGENAPALGDERHDAGRIRWVNGRIRAVAARNVGWVRLVDPLATLCNGSNDPKSETSTGLPLRQDGAHFDEHAAVWFWNSWLAGQIGAAFVGGPRPWPPGSTVTTPGDVPGAAAPAG